MTCPDPLLVQAYADSELDAAAVLEVEQHIASCGVCAALRRDIEETRSRLRTGATYHRLTDTHRAALLSALERGSEAAPRYSVRGNISAIKSQRYWMGAISGALAATLIVSVLATFLRDAQPSSITGDLVGAHARSLLPNRLIDVASSDHHTVKPWFAGRADASPPVVDFPTQGFHLIGGRLDYIDGRRAAVVVYRHNAHVINLFTWPASGAELPTTAQERNGYQLACWHSASLNLCAVSDASPALLRDFTQLLRAAAGPNAPQ